MRIDRIGIALAGVLALVPLLPSGLVHLGWPDRGYVELALPGLAMVWVAARLLAPSTTAPRVPTWPWDLLVAATTGAALYGLMADAPVTSPVFPPRLVADLDDLFRPMHMTAHPLYSLRVGLTFLEGWVAFRLVVAICRLAPDPASRAGLGLAGWLAGLTLVAAGAILQYVTEFNLHPYWVKANPSLVRAHSTLDDPNTLGAFLAVATGLLAGLLRLDGPRRRVLWVGLAALCTIGLVTTMSRSALGAVVLAPLAVLAIGPAPTTRLQARIRLASRIVVLGVLVAIASSMLLRGLVAEQRRTQPTGLVDMLIKTLDPRESTGWVLRGRLPWWRAGAAMVADAPVVGVGLGRYPRLMEGYGGGPMRENTHNLFLQMAAEAGLVGLTAFLVFCGGLGLALGRGVAPRGETRTRAVALGGTIGFAAFVLTLLTGHALLLPSGQILLAAFLATALVIVRMDPAVHGGVTTGPRRRPRAAWVLLLVAVTSFAPLVGLARDIEPRPGRWGHHLGLHDQEHTDAGEPYRWTTDGAILDLRVPEGATALAVDVTAVYPVRDGVPTHVTFATGEATADRTLTSDRRETVRLPLREGTRRVVLEVTVRPTFVPGHGDPRELGVQLFLPAFE